MRALTLFVKVVLFLVTFSLEVSVHASVSLKNVTQPEPKSEAKSASKSASKSGAATHPPIVDLEPRDVIQEPHHCLVAGGVCAVQNLGETGFEMKVGESTVVLDTGASAIRKSNNEIRVVKGTIWIKAQGVLVVGSEFGSAENISTGDFWVTKSDSILTVLAVSSDVTLKPRGSSDQLTVAIGLQNMLGQIGFDGRAATGIPMPIPFKDHVMRWGRLYRGKKATFETDVDAFHIKWQAATEAAAEINRALYDRKIASENAAAQAEAEKKAKVEADNKVYREMFRTRMLEGR